MGLFESIISPGVQNISPNEAVRRLQDDPAIVVVDVRQPVETQSGTVPGAVLIPLTEFSRRLDELPKDRPILTICRSSHRSPIAARQLKKAGYDVTNISSGIIGWQKSGLPIEKPDQTD
jgi:rhodanese-related sulfurtransferase